MQSNPDPPPTRRRTRRVSRNRQTFLTAIEAQLNGTRILALIVLAVCLAGGVYWLVGTTGSPIIGISFIALALVLAFTVYSFVQVMYMFSGGARGAAPHEKNKPT
jgi:cbb3-type cytochrome oxidase subunit 3